MGRGNAVKAVQLRQQAAFTAKQQLAAAPSVPGASNWCDFVRSVIRSRYQGFLEEETVNTMQEHFGSDALSTCNTPALRWRLDEARDVLFCLGRFDVIETKVLLGRGILMNRFSSSGHHHTIRDTQKLFETVLGTRANGYQPMTHLTTRGAIDDAVADFQFSQMCSLSEQGEPRSRTRP
jgi:hypothetical protein